MKPKKIAINVPVDLYDDFRTAAFLTKKTMTEILLKRIQEVVTKERKNGVLKKLL